MPGMDGVTVMKKILFIVPPFNNNSNLQYIAPPLGIIRVASFLDRETYEIKLMDFPLKIKQKEIPAGPDFYQRCALMILAEGIDIIAFTTLFSNYASVLNIARHVSSITKAEGCFSTCVINSPIPFCCCPLN